MHSIGRFPSGLRGPLGASVTLWEATAPVKLPASHCPAPRGPVRARQHAEWYFTVPSAAPARAASTAPAYPTQHAPGPVASCSKAPRGLFVLARVGRIFTATSISPGPPSRQRPDRYTIRAGRNSPDKEFRYLRTVIVTAAVHRGFGSALARLPLTFRHWAGVSPYASSPDLAGTCVFGKQSPGPTSLRPPSAARRKAASRPRVPLLPKLRGQFAEFLDEGSPVRLGALRTRPPASVCGTGTRDSP